MKRLRTERHKRKRCQTCCFVFQYFFNLSRIQYQHSVKQKARWKLWNVWRKITKQLSIVIGPLSTSTLCFSVSSWLKRPMTIDLDIAMEWKYYFVFTKRHGSCIAVTRQWNGCHIAVPNRWELNSFPIENLLLLIPINVHAGCRYLKCSFPSPFLSCFISGLIIKVLTVLCSVENLRKGTRKKLYGINMERIHEDTGTCEVQPSFSTFPFTPLFMWFKNRTTLKGHSLALHCASPLHIISHVISTRALGFFFTAGPRHRCKALFHQKRARWPIIFSVVLNWVMNFSM